MPSRVYTRTEEHRRKTRKKMIDSHKKKWQDPEYQKMMAQARALKPNKPERIFDELTPDIVRYVGNFSFWIVTKSGTHNPDFKIRGQKKIIELFGDYWHKGENPEKLIKEYAKVGWDCIVVWESEFYNEPERILKETLEFINHKRSYKYALKYNKSLTEIAEIFGVSLSTIWNWLNNPEKQKWLEWKLFVNHKNQKVIKETTEMKEKDIIKQRPSKFVLKYGKSLKEIAAIFGVSTTTILTWLNNPDKQKWVEKKLKEKR